MTTFVVLKRLGIALSGLGGRVGCVQDQGLSVCVPRLLGFILLMGFSGALLVSVLDMVWIAICGCFCGPGAPGWPFPGWGGRGACGLCPKSRSRCARALPSEVYPAGKLQ